MILDLEDAVAVGAKAAAREAIRGFLESVAGTGGDTAAGVVVRINGVDTAWFADDVAAVGHGRCAVLVPKAHSETELAELADALPPGTPLIALLETARGVLAAAEVCSVPAVVRAAFGSVDLGAELGVDPDDRDALRYARSAVVLGSAAAGCAAPLDGVTTKPSDDDRLSTDVAHAAALGFGGKLCIHPAQVSAVNALFTPAAAEVAWAERVLAQAQTEGASIVDGAMVDKPVLDRARAILARAQR